MIEICCQCEEGMGLFHLHRTWRRIRSERDGRVFELNEMFLEQPGYTVLAKEDYIVLAVDWRKVAEDLIRG